MLRQAEDALGYGVGTQGLGQRKLYSRVSQEVHAVIHNSLGATVTNSLNLHEDCLLGQQKKWERHGSVGPSSRDTVLSDALLAQPMVT